MSRYPTDTVGTPLVGVRDRELMTGDSVTVKTKLKMFNINVETTKDGHKAHPGNIFWNYRSIFDGSLTLKRNMVVLILWLWQSAH